MPPLDPSILVDHIKAQGRRERKNPGSDGGASSLWTLDPHERLLKMSLQKEQVQQPTKGMPARREGSRLNLFFVPWNTLASSTVFGDVLHYVPIAQVVPRRTASPPPSTR